MQWPARIKKIAGMLLDIAFPFSCIACGREIPAAPSYLCEECFAAISCNSSFFCAACMRRSYDGKAVCHFDSPYMLAPACFYEGPVPALIHAFKYGKMEKVGTMLSSLLIAYMEHLPYDFSQALVACVPLHPLRRRMRGFNQSELLARAVASHFSLPYADLLRRTSFTRPQASQHSAQERQRNMRGCFALREGAALRGRTVIVVDDVSTSGATLHEAARTLKSAGARRIIGLVVAKA
jgi:ComF family protein